ncbi:MAG: tetratricopeptide repeat protein [Deltaproteobacteria bacterium]
MRIVERKAVVSILLFLLAISAFSKSVGGDFVWDDVEVIGKSHGSFRASEIVSALIPPEKETKQARYYRPVFYASIVADKSLWGAKAFGFHLSNLIFHSAATVVVYLMAFFVLRGFKARKPEAASALAGVFFALHPMHVESVSWVAGRTDLLCGLFFFGAFAIHSLPRKNSIFAAAASLFFALALLSKEVALAFPIVALGFDIISRRRLGNKESAVKYGGYLALAGVYLYLRGRAFVNIPDIPAAASGEGGGGIEAGSRILEAAQTLLPAHLYYLNKLAFPFDFNSFITSVPTDALYLASAAALILVLSLAAALSVAKRENVWGFSIFWIFATLGPSSLIAIFPIASTPLAERYLYIPSAGFCLLLGYLITEAALRFRSDKLIPALAIIIALPYFLLSWHRQEVWSADLQLWADASAKSPYHALTHTNYGVALKNAAMPKEAEREFLIALSPDVTDTNEGRAVTANNLGVLYLEREDYRRAEKWFNKAVEFSPNYGLSYYHLGLINFIKGEYTSSESDYRKSLEYLTQMLRFYSSYGRGRLLLANVYLRLGKGDRASEEARRAIRDGIEPILFKEAEEIIRVNEQSRDKKP